MGSAQSSAFGVRAEAFGEPRHAPSVRRDVEAHAVEQDEGQPFRERRPQGRAGGELSRGRRGGHDPHHHRRDANHQDDR